MIGGGSRSSSGSSRGSLFGGSAPSRGYSTAAPASSVNTRNPSQSYAPPPAKQQVPHAQTSAPHPQQHAQQQAPAQSGGMLSGLMGGVMQGMAFGGGSAVAHRAIDGVMGPRTVVHDHQGNAVDQSQQNSNALNTPSMMSDQQAADNGACKDDVFAFNKCMIDNNNNFNSCQFMYDVLSQCRRNVTENKAWQ